MAREPDPDSRPISVAEILARRAAQDAAGDTPPAADAPTGRRRRGGEGTVSVAELTGEIPRIRGGAHSGSFRAVDREEADAQPSDPAPAQTPDPAPTTGRRRRPEAGDAATVGDELTEVAPSTGALAAESSFVPDASAVTDSARTSTFPRSDRPTAPGPDDHFPRSESPRPTWGGSQAWSSPTPARPDQPPATRDLNSADVHARFGRPAAPEPQRPAPEDADEATGIIPRFGSAPADAADDLAGLSPEERDRAFESYRNFDDVDVEEEAPRKRRGLFGALRRPKTDDDAPATDDRADESSIAHTELLSGRPEAVDDGRLEVPDDTPTELTDVSEPAWGARAWSDRPDVDDAPRAAIADTRDDEQPWTTRFDAETPAAPAADTGVVDLDKAQRRDTVRPAWRGSDTAATPASTPDEDVAEGPSPARQWAVLGLQVIAGLVVGVGLFLGFTELWRWNVYFALVLAIVVIFGLVTFVHVVRRSNDLLSTLIALAVGLIVTIGPLALLASGS